ncbi:MAG: succinate dehydrogenase cytochrome b subunit [Rikenellaceae bacterium]|nr:succinate dehydrogenase cytochrome b subunit [Rikenellaceae bacterium]MCL2692555.1 succinate dehydrogenase cytochrome b subunit [Rikenellaceae bacterium]
MKNFLTSSSIGKKLVMSISGAFLVLFLTFHMAMNLVSIISAEAYNSIAAFLGANWYALAGTMLLAAGVAVHILFASVLTFQNWRATRGAVSLQQVREKGLRRYAVERRRDGVSWSSRNMFVLGAIVAIGLLLHLWHFWWNMQLQEVLGEHYNRFGYSVTDGVSLIAKTFANPLYCAVYLLWFTAIWFHLTHGFWSMFQSIGWANKRWYPRLKAVATAYATLVMLGYAVVVVVFFLRSRGLM